MHQIKPLKFKTLDGLSERQLAEHHDILYAGYVNKLNEIEGKLETTDRATANGTYGEFRELKKEEVFATNGIQLHEGYFENLGGLPGQGLSGQGDGNAPEEIKDLLTKYFDSYEKWETDFKACGISARGWVVLAYNFEDKKLHNYICDVHDVGGVWSCIPLLVLDVYEHAYFLDYGTKRKDYIEKFMKNIDWQKVLKRYSKVQ